MSVELPKRDVEIVLRGGPSGSDIVISDIRGVVPGLVGYEPTGERDEHGRWILKWVPDTESRGSD